METPRLEASAMSTYLEGPAERDPRLLGLNSHPFHS